MAGNLPPLNPTGNAALNPTRFSCTTMAEVIPPTNPTNEVRRTISSYDSTMAEVIPPSTYANRVLVPNFDTVEHVNYVVTDKDREAVRGFTDNQWCSLKNILNAGKKVSTEELMGKSCSPSWIMDTGASHHLTGKFEILTNVRDMAPVLIVLADGRERVSSKEGSIRLGTDLVMKSVFYVEEFQSDLISIGQLMDENHCVLQMAEHFLVVQDRISRTLIGAGVRVGGTFHFRSTEFAASVTTREETKYALWHNRMGHPAAKVVGLLPDISVSISSTNLNKACDICLRAKQTRTSFLLSLNKTLDIFELIHCDLWGPYRVPSHSGAKYFLTIVDDYSRGVWLYLLADKTEAPVHLQNFFALTERQFHRKVKTVRSDNGTEFMCLTKFFRENGIAHERSCVSTPEQNGRVERKHRHILNVARALRFQAGLPIEFWGECVLTAAYLINRTPSSVLNNVTLYERIHKKPPQFNHLLVFGSLCYAHNQRRHGDKFESRSRKCIFVGYPLGQKGWRLYDVETQEFFVSRDVVFSESEFPFSQGTLMEAQVIEKKVDELWAPILQGPLEEELSNHNLSPTHNTDPINSDLAQPDLQQSDNRSIPALTPTDQSVAEIRIPVVSDHHPVLPAGTAEQGESTSNTGATTTKPAKRTRSVRIPEVVVPQVPPVTRQSKQKR